MWDWIIIGTVVAVFVVGFLRRFDNPKALRQRESQAQLWEQRFPAQVNLVDRVLGCVVNSFDLKEHLKWRIAPDDELGQLCLWTGSVDGMEVVDFWMEIQDVFEVETPESIDVTTVGDVVAYISELREKPNCSADA